MSKEDKIIDIIIPCYNAHESLDKTLQSITEQSIVDKTKVLIVDDHSEKDYESFINKYNNLDLSILRLKTNSGPGVAREQGIQNTNCKYITFIDSDDKLFSPKSLEFLLESIETGYDVVNSVEFDEKRKKYTLSKGNVHGKIYRRKYLEDNSIHFNNNRYHEDNYFNNLVLLSGAKYLELKQCTYFYTYNEKSITNKDSKEFERLELYLQNIYELTKICEQKKYPKELYNRFIKEKYSYLKNIFKPLKSKEKEIFIKWIKEYIPEFIEFILLDDKEFEEKLQKLIGEDKISLKEKYTKDINNRFEGKTKDILLNHLDLFYKEDISISKNHYEIGEEVKLKRGTFIHGIAGGIKEFEYVMIHGLVSTDFTSEPRPNKICNSVGVWNIKEDMLLKDYINLYSGFTVTYNIGRGPGSQTKSMLIPYHQFDKLTERINNDPNIWSYSGEQTKEVRFIPSLVSNKRHIAFILNMESEYAKQLAHDDVWNTELDEEIIKPFLDYRYADKFINEDRINRTAITTDRESAIMFGLPTSLIEGVLLSRNMEKNKDIIKIIKENLPDCYICNLDGKVIVGNK